MKAAVALAAVAIVFLHFKATSTKTLIPSEIEDVVKNKDAIMARFTDPETRLSLSDRINKADKCEAPDSPNVKVIVTNKTLSLKTWVLNQCSLVTVPVKIPMEAGHEFPQSTHVKLSRCMDNNIHIPHYTHCKVKRKGQITVKYRPLLVGGQETRAEKEFDSKMYNHTACTIGCILKPHQCHPVNQEYDGNNCRCKCLMNESSCDSTYQYFSKYRCECRCKYAPYKCGLYREWSPEKCRCECAKGIKKFCKKENYVQDKSTCLCVKPKRSTKHKDDSSTTDS